MAWKKSHLSNPSGNCPQVARTSNGPDADVLVNDSKNPDGPRLRFTQTEWAMFLEGVRLSRDLDFVNLGLPE